MATIFLVDDSLTYRNLYSQKLEQRGYKVRTFELASGLLEALQDEVPDLVVSDIVMPEMDGVELCAQIRKSFPKEILPILLVSSLDTMDHMVRGYEAGADDYLVKPVRTPEFHAKVSLLLRQRRALVSSQKADESRDPNAPPAKIIDRYVIIDILGEGAYGKVYRARRLGCEDIIALKILSQGKLSKRSIARFLRETEVLKTLGEVDGISRILDVGFDGEHYFYAMDLIKGGTLRDILKKDGPMSEYAALRVAHDIGIVLSALTQAEVVHRDIKPENIVLAEDGKPTLIDFGLARLNESITVTQRHELPGTPAYIPPETIRGSAFDMRGDIYSLGVTIFETLTNQLPYEGTGGFYTLVKIAEGAPPNLDPLIDADVSPGFGAIIERMISNEPDERYQNAEELVADLASYL